MTQDNGRTDRAGDVSDRSCAMHSGNVAFVAVSAVSIAGVS